MVKTIDLRKKSIQALHRKKASLLRQIQIPPDFVRASYVRQYVTCGKTNCRCRRGFKHGPFFYLTQCVRSGRVRKFLLKTSEQREQARAGIAAQAQHQAQLEELSQINTELLRRGNLTAKSAD